MRYQLSLLTLCLFAAATAHAQDVPAYQAPSPGIVTAFEVERYSDYSPSQLLTAADSARERARQENIRQLRKPESRRRVPTTTAFAVTPPTPAEMEARAYRRSEEERQMIDEALIFHKWKRPAASAADPKQKKQRGRQ